MTLYAQDAVEDYFDFSRDPCVRVLAWGHDNRPIHMVWHVAWSIPNCESEQVVMVTP